MEKSFIRLAVVMACAGLSACTSYTGTDTSYNSSSTGTTQQMAQNKNQNDMSQGQGTENLASIGGSVRGSMDSMDASKMSHALDKSPGKSTKWTNTNSGTTYTVTPTQAVTVGGNHFCRTYNVKAETTTGGMQTSSGTACVVKGSWGEV